MTEFFTADWHLFHRNIIRYCNRPYRNVKEMHQNLIDNHNQIVEEEDEVWFLGDLCFMSPEYVGRIKKEVDKFNGIKHIVLGNHDNWKTRAYLNAGFLTVHSAMWFNRDNYTFYMMHDPAEYTVIQNDPKAIMLCGHIHQLFKHLLPEKKIINVGVDAWNMKPVSYESIFKLLAEHGIMTEGLSI